jgi:DNA-binding MarR family transcriptional regulator
MTLVRRSGKPAKSAASRLAGSPPAGKKTNRKTRLAASVRFPKRAATPIERLAPDDEALREFIADLYGAISIMRILRRQIARTVDLSSAEFSVLLAVWHLERHGEMTVKAIADHLHVAAAHVTAEIGQLVNTGLLAKAAHRSDKRAVGIALSRAGRDLFHRVMPMLREINDRLFAGASYGEMARVHRFLGGIIEHGNDALRVTEAYMPKPASAARRAGSTAS